MPANSPEEICRLFQQHMAAGDINAVLGLYDSEAVFLSQSGETRRGHEELKQELAPLAAAKARFEFHIEQVIRSGDIALMHTKWSVSGPQTMRVHAVEVARRQKDGTWRWLIGDPFTVGRIAA
ncbi:MAG TPA: nuclear transport factor 2 family protein [Candidatus Saccharimonadales bacterium]|jgi:ketosteroid isomerase-like protein|nr:nuclear transport factor 2 family protein [Candidatus Saccharimonadales bacterium]